MSEVVIARPAEQCELYYGGDWHAPREGVYADTVNPATGEKLSRVAQASAADVDAAVAAAQQGFEAWRERSPIERTQVLRQAADILRAHAEELAQLDSLDAGNPLREMRNDMAFSAASIEYFAGLATELKGNTHPLGSNLLNYTVREPLGVIARINAYNHPLMFAAMRMAAPLAAGNSVILKPADQAPLSTLRLADLIGSLFPAGVFTVLPGDRLCGEALVDHPRIAKIGLIGSVDSGRAVAARGGQRLKKIALELGGKNALIAYPDSNPHMVAAGAMRGMNFGVCGQSCGSTTRLFLHESVYDVVVGELLDEMQKLRLGLPIDPETQMGCLISRDQRDKVLGYIALGQDEGARLLAGGRVPKDEALANGFFVEPTLFGEAHAGMRIAREEIFGPVVVAIRWEDEDAMLKAVNDTDLGLTASIWTSDIARAHRVAAKVEAGYVWINNTSRHFLGAPFGGYKQSGLGREESIDELFDSTQVKHVSVSLD